MSTIPRDFLESKQFARFDSQTEMSEDEPLHDQGVGQHCCLCFHWTEEALYGEQLVDIFSFNERLNSTLAEKIRDWLGLNINPDDSKSKICLNCENTINFIDEFQFLCRQTEEIYESTQFRFSDVSRWKCYNNHISELRTLVREQREYVDNISDDTALRNSVIIEDDNKIFTPEFIVVKEEKNEENIHDESLSEVKTELESIEPVLEAFGSSDVRPTIVKDRDSRFHTKLKIAKELQAQKCDKPDFKSICQKTNLGISEIKQLWKEMGNFYRMSKKYAYAGRRGSISRCRRCPLFNILNIIIPKFYGDEPYEENKIRTAKNNDRCKMSFDVLVAIAEEIKAHPELWVLSLNSSAHSMNILWKKIARKFGMSMHTLRAHWRRLRDIYRTYKTRELKGIQKQQPTDEKYNYLVSILHELLASTTHIQLPMDSTEQTAMPEDEVENPVEQRDGHFYQNDQKLSLAQEIRKCPIICFHNTEMRDQTWQNIVEISGADREVVKQEWEQLRNMFRNRNLRLLKGKLNSDDALIVDPLYKVLDEMFQENKRFTERKVEENNLDKKFDDATKMEFAKVCHDHDILWNMTHPNYTAQNKRNEVWDLIAFQFGVSQEKIKSEWISLRNMYRNRFLRSQNSSIKSRKSNDPLHQLMKSMFEEHMNKVYGNNVETIQSDTTDQKPFSASEDKIRLVEEISMYENLWNMKNSKKSALREASFEEIAAKLGHPSSIIKEEWKKLRTMHLHRQHLIARGRSDQIKNSVDPLHAQLDKLLPPKSFKATTDGDDSKNEEEAYPKRRFTGKRRFSDDGCVQIEVYGTLRHAKVCELCGKKVQRSYFEYHMNAHYGLTPYACSFEGCDKKYSNKSIRDKHEVDVHGEDGYLFQCDLCDKKFKQKAKYKYHYAVKHKSDEVPCDICGKLLKHKNLLPKHKETHLINYECPVCGKILQKKYTLSVHMRVHTKEKPYPCELCEQRFMLKVQMKTHLLKVHGVVWEELQATTTLTKK